MRIRGRHLLVAISMCGLSAATVGLITNVAGLFFTPYVDEFGILQGTASLTLTIANICVALGGLFTRRLTKLLPLHLVLVVGTALMAGSSLLTSVATGIIPILVLAAIRGLAGGVVGFVLITYVLNKWFVEKLGIVTSVAMGTSGLAGAVFTPALQSTIAGMGWRAGQVLLAIITVGLCLPSILLVPSCDPQDAGLAPFCARGTAGSNDAGQAEQVPVSIDKALAAGVVLYGIVTAAVTAMPQHFPGLAKEIGLDAATGALMMSVCMVTNTLGKVVLGWLCDRFGARFSMQLYTLLVGASVVALLVVHAPVAALAASLLFGLCYARNTVGLSMMCRELFGKHGFGVVYPIGNMGMSLSNAVFSSLVGYGYDLTGGYGISLVTFLVFCGIAAALTTWCYRRGNVQE